MQGDKQVIDYLNELLAGELTAIDQYFVHSRMYQNWGLHKLYERIAHEVQDETNHADALIKRILFLEGTPNLSKRDPLLVGATVPEMLKNDLAVEISVVGALRKVIAYCESVRDYQTREILEVMLDDTEEDHAHWLEQQLGLIQMVGLENYLQSQM
ncbi:MULTISPECIES: bacterioferritin [Methylomonas]|uniref:Bacterioferritin n=1 Tax=Methylomonas koyamae TaxID=702114 RepID=A0A177NIC4_9GAMM|nr:MULTISPECIES: bacterioferritin [Methylomonas]MDT4331780.1 bacterioferritin [Methylomonas sp. MV1]OAI17203.1 bacterioferritin [Methylomonas koyamae]WGS83820.1 bacterioferritin [Methylomonas sp. UP202]